MGLKKLRQRLSGCRKLAFDSAPIIYFVESNPRYKQVVDEIFTPIGNRQIKGTSSIITLVEVLIRPMEMQFSSLIDTYKKVFTPDGGIQAIFVNDDIAIKAAELRAKYAKSTIKTPDAIHLATAILENCDVMVTNDVRWKKVGEIDIIVLEDHLV